MQLGKKRDAAEQERVLMAAALTHGIGHANFAFGLYMAAEFSVPRASEGATRLTEVRVLDPTYIYCNPRVVNALLAQYEGDGAKGRIFGPSARVLRLSGGPSTPQMRGFIAEQGIDVGETYGASEAGAIACTPFGQTGMRVLPDVEVKIGDDNELLVRTARGMTCYYGDDSLRDQYFTDDGFYITGDRGQLTEKGELRFWSRKRDALTLPDGTTINPVWIESLLEARAWVSQVVLIGDQRPYLVALIVVRDEHDSRFEDGYLEPGAHGELFSRARADIEIVNAKLEPMERIRRFALFSRPMPPEIYAEARGGKTRRERGAIERMFADRIDALYANVV
jgi:long-chain acyl-CoA synthetase